MDQMDNNMENNMQPAGMGQPDGMGDNKGWAIARIGTGHSFYCVRMDLCVRWLNFGHCWHCGKREGP